MTAVDTTRLTSVLEAHLPRLIELRRELHEHPQIGYEETYASQLVQRELTQAGVPFAANLAKTGVVGWLTPAGAAPGEAAVGLRADMDALPIQEETGLPWASTHPGRMHACGHDGHVAILLGAARVLAELRAQLPRPVKFIFQPAEEGGAGAARMIEAGCLDERIGGVRVGMMFGLHGWPALPLGMVATRPGALLAGTDLFRIEVRGRGGHAALPHRAADAILAAAHVITALQSIVSRNVDPCTPAVVSVAVIQAGSTENVLPPTARLAGTIRALDEPTALLLHERIGQIARQVCAALGCEAQVQIERGYPPTHNDPQATQCLRAVAQHPAAGVRVVAPEAPEMVAEDFAYYGRSVPACFFALGLRQPGGAEAPGLHTPQFDFNDDAIRIGVRLMCLLALTP